MPVRIDWNRQPVSIHSEDRQELEELIQFLKAKHSIRKRSIIMQDRENSGIFYFYLPTMRPTLDSGILSELKAWAIENSYLCLHLIMNW